MITKPKTRKAPAARPAMPKSTVVATSEPKREVSEICALEARWNWLDADQEYQASIAETDDESERLGTIHNTEQKEIERKLTTLVPESFEDDYATLEFATNVVEDGGMILGSGTDIIKNVRECLSWIRRDEMDAERAKYRMGIQSR